MQNNYNQCKIKISIPEVIFTDEECVVSFSAIGNEGCEGVITTIKTCAIQDQLKNRFDMKSSEYISQKITHKNARKSISLRIPYLREKFVIRKARLAIRILDITNRQTITSHYLINNDRKLDFLGVVINTFSEQENKNFKLSDIQQREDVDLKENNTDRKEISTPKTIHSSIYLDTLVNKYKEALTEEICFLKNDGGRRYKVTNGKLISKSFGDYAYVFELETELYLSDATPVKLVLGTQEFEGELLICEDFHITVILKKFIGENNISAHISVEPWKLLEALREKLDMLGNGLNYDIANQLILGGPNFDIHKGIDSIIKGQEQAIEHAKKSPITIIWGPPGTGKTYTMSKLALYYMSKKKKVLIVSHSNVSVDGVVKKIVDRLHENGKEEILRDGNILRYGYVRDEELSQNQYATSFNYAVQKVPDFAIQRKELEEQKQKLKREGKLHSEQGIEVEKKMQNLRAQVREIEKSAVLEAKIVATTISKVVIDKLFDGAMYDVVMFDEASMAYVPQVFVAAFKAKEHFICVGDFFQLPPIAQSQAKDVLEEDIYLFLNIVDKFGQLKYHPWLVMLDTQRRMHPQIAEFSNTFIYHKMLKNDVEAVKRIQLITNYEPFEKQPVILFDLRGTYCAAYKNSDNSRFNILSAFIAFNTALDIEKKNKCTVGIITPYVAQTRLIRAMIKDYRQSNVTNIVCSTVHQFQGSEKDVIIFDAVESYPAAKPGWLMTKNENNKVTRLINVAVTRAKGKLITICNSTFWNRKLEGTRNAFYELLRYQTDKGKIIVKDELKAFLASADNGVMNFYQTKEEYLAVIKNDIYNAKDKIIISLPNGDLAMEEEKIIIEQLILARQKGVSVSMKSNDYATLPTSWKGIGVETENAVFPIIMIDGVVTWYGIPNSKAAFTDKDMKFFNICNMVIRFKGKNTADIINSFSEFDQVIVGNNRRLLAGKNTANLSGVEEANGLGKYIENTYKCPKCNIHLSLKRGRSGKYYIGCNKCKHMEYLTPETVDRYIVLNNIRCNEHNCKIEARLNKNGVYIRCSNRIQRHSWKLDEI